VHVVPPDFNLPPSDKEMTVQMIAPGKTAVEQFKTLRPHAGEVISDGPEPHSEVSTVEMLQNKKTAPVSTGLKSFDGVVRSGEKVTK
jgi:hypothetical protein